MTTKYIKKYQVRYTQHLPVDEDDFMGEGEWYVDEDFCQDEDGVWNFDTYEEAEALFEEVIKKDGDHSWCGWDYYKITETPLLLEDEWERIYPEIHFPTPIILKEWEYKS